MEKTSNFFKLKNVWIIAGILCLFENFISALLITKGFYLLYPVSNVIWGIIIFIITFFVYKNHKINVSIFVFSIILSFLLNILSPVSAILPLIVLTAFQSTKKIGVFKWIFGILYITVSTLLSGPFALAIYMGMYDYIYPTSDIVYLPIYYALINCINLPIITLFGVILGNKKSMWYYFLPIIPILYFILLFI